MEMPSSQASLPDNGAESMPPNASDLVDGQPPATGFGVAAYLRAVYRHRWLAVATLVLVTAPIVAWAWWQQPVYQAEVSLVIDPEPSSPLPFPDAAQGQPSPDQFQTQQELLRGTRIALRTITALSLWEYPEFATSGQPAPSADATGVALERDAAGQVVIDPRAAPLVGAFLGRVRTGAIPLTRVVNVWFEARDPQLAADAANELANQFIAQDLYTRVEATRQSSEWLEARLAEQRVKVEQSEAALQRYREQPNASTVGSSANIVTQRLADLNAAVTRARTERLLKEAAYRQLEEAQVGGGLDAIPVVASNPVVQQLRAQEGQLVREEAELSRRFGERHPEMIKVRTALEQTRQRQAAEVAKVAEVVRNEYEAALENEGSLTAALEGQKTATVQQGRQELEFGRLEREVQTSRQIFDAILQQARQLGISSELKQTAVRVLDKAETPLLPIRPNRPMTTALGLVIGLFAAAAVVFGREYLDPRLKTPDDLRGYLRLPFLGLIPSVDDARSGDEGPAFVAGSHLGFTEALRRIRTHLVLLGPRPGLQTLLVTSTGPQEGKTTICVGLARSLAAAGNRVLLVDADLRRPTAHAALGLERTPGLTDFLRTKTGLAEIVRPSGTERLSIVTAGTPTNSSTELLSAHGFARFLEAQERAFDWVLVDSPPVLSASDAALLSRLATGVLFVVGAEMTPRGSAERAVEQLVTARAKFAGVVLNKAAVARHSRYYAPYYSEKYESYYAQPEVE